MRFLLPAIFAPTFVSTLIVASLAHAAESPATAEREGPAVDTSEMNVSQAPSPQRADGPQAVMRTDRLELDTTVVTGNRELPKVLYIVPWKKSDLGELPAQPFNTLLDEALTPLDRDVFRREVTYYGAIAADARGGPDGGPAPAESTEK